MGLLDPILFDPDQIFLIFSMTDILFARRIIHVNVSKTGGFSLHPPPRQIITLLPILRTCVRARCIKMIDKGREPRMHIDTK